MLFGFVQVSVRWHFTHLGLVMPKILAPVVLHDTCAYFSYPNSNFDVFNFSDVLVIVFISLPFSKFLYIRPMIIILNPVSDSSSVVSSRLMIFGMPPNTL